MSEEPELETQPKFEVTESKGRQLVVCTYKGGVGSARVFSAGMDDARSRAEAQARQNSGKADAATG